MNPAAEFYNVLPFDPGQIVGDLLFPAGFPLLSALAGITRKAGVAGPGEGRQAGDAGILVSFEARNPRLFVEVRTLTLKIGVRPVLAIGEAHSNLMDDRRPDRKSTRL